MATLTLKDLPEELHQRLRERAEAHGRSLNKEIITSLEQMTSPRRLGVSEYLSRVERVRDQIDFEVTLDEIEGAIEAGRP
ncbi:MAG: Arc family DNA-binding protein [Verrucomicrobiales bacterium]